MLFSQEESDANSIDFQLELTGEYRYFYDAPQFNQQLDHYPSISATPELSYDWNDGYDVINFEGFVRLDRDEKRTHWDIRELYYSRARKNWEVSIGLKKVFWGVTESNHLVDIINQTDQVESFDGERKLGQPMVQFTYNTDKLGTFDFFYLPYHRSRTLPGAKGRLRFSRVIDSDDIQYESSSEEWRQDFALRWKYFVGIMDLGLSYFHGNGREPLFTPQSTGEVQAFYPVINQVGLDLQLTDNAFLWKLESIYRAADAQDFFALTAGLEYTFGNINGKGLDIGLLGEYNFDDRDDLALNALENDVFLGSRLAFNDSSDTAILLGTILDLDSTSKVFSVEASRRIGSNFKVEVEARIFNDIDTSEFILNNFSEDSFFKLSVSRFF